MWVELACLLRPGVQSQLEVGLQTDIFLLEPLKLKVDECVVGTSPGTQCSRLGLHVLSYGKGFYRNQHC